MHPHPSILPVVLCGGSGTRLWPLSRKALPKQFVPLLNGRTLLEATIERVHGLAGANAGPVLVGAEEHRFMLRDALAAVGVQGSVFLEPCARNTAAAMTLAALLAGDREQLMLFCPSDHHIPDGEHFRSMARSAAAAARPGRIVTFGVAPTFPSTAYGYIERSEEAADGGFAVRRFIEKPNSEVAQQLLLGGDVYWNAGIFLCTAGTLIDAMRTHAADVLVQCEKAIAACTRDGEFVRPDEAALQACRSESIDYAVMEHHPDVVVFPFHAAWSDVGSWNAVADLTPADAEGNRIDGQGLAVRAKNTYIHAPSRRVVALGTEDMIIVDTPDAVLVAHRSRAEEVKNVVAELESRKTPEAAAHRKVARPWGYYDSIEEGERFKVKRIVVKPNASLSLQKHYHRAEHWIVVKGTAEVTCGAKTFLLSENESTFIPLGQVHRLHNPGKTPLEMIEVQSGSYLGEDDIVRMEDSYGRAVVPIAGKRRT